MADLELVRAKSRCYLRALTTKGEMYLWGTFDNVSTEDTVSFPMDVYDDVIETLAEVEGLTIDYK